MVVLGEFGRILLEGRRASAAAEEVAVALVIGKHFLLGRGLYIYVVAGHNGALHGSLVIRRCNCEGSYARNGCDGKQKRLHSVKSPLKEFGRLPRGSSGRAQTKLW